MPVKFSRDYARDVVVAWADRDTPVHHLSTITPLERRRDSEILPKYKQIIADGGNATTALSAHMNTVKIEPGKTVFTFAGSQKLFTDTGLGIYGPYYYDPALFALDPWPQMRAKAEAKAVSQVYSSIAKYSTPFQGQIFAGELREVLDLMRSPLGKMTKLTDEFIRKVSLDRSRAKWQKGEPYYNNKPLYKALADQWLEFRFAILPLMSDISSLLTLSTDIALKRQHETVRGYGEAMDANSPTVTEQAGYTNGISGVNATSSTLRVQNIIRVGMSAQFLDKLTLARSPILDSVDDFMSLPVTAWELIPFSFLLDYFVNIGDIIQSAVVTQSGIAYVSNSRIYTYESKRHSIATHSSREDIVKSIISSTPKIVVSKTRRVIRDSTLQAIPPLVFSLPGSYVRYGNIGALITSWYSSSARIR